MYRCAYCRPDHVQIAKQNRVQYSMSRHDRGTDRLPVYVLRRHARASASQTQPPPVPPEPPPEPEPASPTTPTSPDPSTPDSALSSPGQSPAGQSPAPAPPPEPPPDPTSLAAGIRRSTRLNGRRVRVNHFSQAQHPDDEIGNIGNGQALAAPPPAQPPPQPSVPIARRVPFVKETTLQSGGGISGATHCQRPSQSRLSETSPGGDEGGLSSLRGSALG